MKICSLLPSATEIVYALGLGDSMVAVSHECDYPFEARRKPVITASALKVGDLTPREIDHGIKAQLHKGRSIYHLDEELLKRLRPDLILTQELCEVCAVAYSEVLQAAKVLSGEPTIVSLEPNTLEDILDNILQVGRLTGTQDKADEVVASLSRRIRDVVATARRASNRPRVLCLEWLDPTYIGGHWVPQMVEQAGGTDGLGIKGQRSSVVPWEQIAAYAPEIVVLMPCGFGVERTLKELKRFVLPAQWYNLPAVRNGQVYAVDGSSYFSRPGPRVVDGLEILAQIIHPELFPRTASADALFPLAGSSYMSASPERVQESKRQ